MSSVTYTQNIINTVLTDDVQVANSLPTSQFFECLRGHRKFGPLVATQAVVQAESGVAQSSGMVHVLDRSNAIHVALISLRLGEG